MTSRRFDGQNHLSDWPRSSISTELDCMALCASFWMDRYDFLDPRRENHHHTHDQNSSFLDEKHIFPVKLAITLTKKWKLACCRETDHLDVYYKDLFGSNIPVEDFLKYILGSIKHMYWLSIKLFDVIWTFLDGYARLDVDMIWSVTHRTSFLPPFIFLANFKNSYFGFFIIFGFLEFPQRRITTNGF